MINYVVKCDDVMLEMSNIYLVTGLLLTLEIMTRLQFPLCILAINKYTLGGCTTTC